MTGGYMRKLDDAQRAAILADYVAGVPIKIIADKHGVDESYPRQLHKRQVKGYTPPRTPRLAKLAAVE